MKTRAFPLAFVAMTALANATFVQAEDPKTVVNPPYHSDSLQYGYSQATVAPPRARLTHVAGQVGLAEDGPNDFEHQVDRAFENLIAALEAAGGQVDDVVKITLLVKDHNVEKPKYLVEKRRTVFGSKPPACTLIPVIALYADEGLFEIDSVAVSPQ
jgi:enamine deaminase RidA (YjgF/YER057c/UK114 family)